MKRLACLLALLVPLALGGCFDPDEPPCAFSCGDNGACPTDYMCLSDGFCHLHGKPGACGFPDAAQPGTDMHVGMDLMTPEDGGTDAQAPDLSMPDLQAPADLSTAD